MTTVRRKPSSVREYLWRIPVRETVKQSGSICNGECRLLPVLALKAA